MNIETKMEQQKSLTPIKKDTKLISKRVLMCNGINYRTSKLSWTDKTQSTLSTDIYMALKKMTDIN